MHTPRSTPRSPFSSAPTSPVDTSSVPLAPAPESPASANPFDEPHIRSLLGGDFQQINDAFALIEQHLHPTLTLWLQQRLPCLAPHDLDDVWSEPLLSALNAARAGRFDSDRPLLPWLCHIAQRRAVDHLRRRATLSRTRRRLQRRARSSRNSHSRPADTTSTQEILDLLRDFLPNLPPRQNLVLDVFLDQLPEPPPLAVLHQEVIRRGGQDTSLFAVQRALQVVRDKLRLFLGERGYVLPAGVA